MCEGTSACLVVRDPAGFLGSYSESLSGSVIGAGAVPALKNTLTGESEDHIKVTLVPTPAGRHSLTRLHHGLSSSNGVRACGTGLAGAPVCFYMCVVWHVHVDAGRLRQCGRLDSWESTMHPTLLCSPRRMC